MEISKMVITGGPCAGKSSAMSELEISDAGQEICLHERLKVIRKVTKDGNYKNSYLVMR